MALTLHSRAPFWIEISTAWGADDSPTAKVSNYCQFTEGRWVLIWEEREAFRPTCSSIQLANTLIAKPNSKQGVESFPIMLTKRLLQPVNKSTFNKPVWQTANRTFIWSTFAEKLSYYWPHLHSDIFLSSLLWRSVPYLGRHLGAFARLFAVTCFLPLMSGD